MRTLTRLSGEYVTFDQIVPKCRFGDFEFLAANLPNWRFRRSKNVIRTIGKIVKAEGFVSSYVLSFRSDDATILRNVKNGHFGRESQNNTTTLVAIAITTKIVIEKQQRIAEVAETAPSCKYCVAKKVARPLRTTVKGGGQPSGRKIRLLICNIRLLQSHMRLKKNRPFNHWLKSQGHYLLCFSTSNQSEPIRFACDMRLRPATA